MMGLIIVGIGDVSALFLPLEACALLASKAIWLVNTKKKRATVGWLWKSKRFRCS